MNSRQRHKRRVQVQIRARMDKTALLIEFLKSLPPAFRELYRGASWQMPESDTHWLDGLRSTEYGACWMPPTTTPAASGVGQQPQENQ
jgi:hypothetical protein